MGILTAEGMIAVEKAKKNRENALKKLTSQPFDIKNEQQLNDLREYIKNFECSVNQMYLFQGMSTGFTTWGGAWLIGFLLPIPEFANYFLNMFLYCGLAGYLLQNYSVTDFHNQLEEMKILYNWCLKKGGSEYDGTDNSEILSNSAIQQLIKLIAPLCTTDFMLTWEKISGVEKPKNTLYNAVSYAYSLFSAKPNVDQNRLHALKTSIEQRDFDLTTFTGFEHSIRYFATNPHFRELLMTKVKYSGEMIKDILPSMLKNAI